MIYLICVAIVICLSFVYIYYTHKKKEAIRAEYEKEQLFKKSQEEWLNSVTRKNYRD